MLGTIDTMGATTTLNNNRVTYAVSMVDGKAFAVYPPASLLQSYEWGQFKQRFGWCPYFFLVTPQCHNGDDIGIAESRSNGEDIGSRDRHGNGRESIQEVSRDNSRVDSSYNHVPSPENGEMTNQTEQNDIANNNIDDTQLHPIPLLVLTRTVARMFRIGYCAYAPLTGLNDWSHQEYVNMIHTISQQITKLIMPEPTILRWDMLAPYSALHDILSTAHSANIPLKKSPHDIQPASTTIIDITKDAKELLESMKAKTRYNIRLSEKKGVVVNVTAAPLSKLSKWYTLYRQTAQRDKIAIHSFDYYKTLFDILNAKRNEVKLELLYAEYSREMIGGILVCYIGRQATYLYGASSNNHRNKMGNYLLQWHAIQRAQQMRCNTYDLFGIPPQHNQSHAMGGLYRFKVGFNGDIVERVGCIDWIHKPLAAGICRATERIYFWLHALKKRFK